MQDNLKIFSNFFSSNVHLLKKGDNNWPAERILFQLAFEHAENSPITKQAEDYLSNGRIDWNWWKQINRKEKYGLNPNFRTLNHHKNKVSGLFLIDNTTIFSWSWESGQFIISSIIDSTFKVIFEDHRSYEYKVQRRGNHFFFREGTERRIIYFNFEHDVIVEEVTIAEELDHCDVSSKYNLWIDNFLAAKEVKNNINQKKELGLKRFQILFTEYELDNLDFSKDSMGANLSFNLKGENQILDIAKADSIKGSYKKNNIRVWNLQEGTFNVLEGHTGCIKGVCLIGENQAISWSWGSVWDSVTLRKKDDGSGIVLWNLEDGSYKLFEGHTDQINGVLIIDDNRVLSYSSDSTLRLWNLQDGSSNVFEGHTDQINGVLLIDDYRVLSYSYDSTFRIWNLKDGTSKEYIGHHDKITSVSILNGKTLISSSEDSSLKLWNLDVEPQLNKRILQKELLKYDQAILLWKTGELVLKNLQQNKFIPIEKSVKHFSVLSNNLICYSTNEKTTIISVKDEVNEESVKTGTLINKDACLLVGSNDLIFYDKGTKLNIWNILNNEISIIDSVHQENIVGLIAYENLIISWANDFSLQVWDTKLNKIEDFRGPSDFDAYKDYEVPMHLTGVRVINNSILCAFYNDSMAEIGLIQIIDIVHNTSNTYYSKIDEIKDVFVLRSRDSILIFGNNTIEFFDIDKEKYSPIYENDVQGFLENKAGKLLTWSIDIIRIHSLPELSVEKSFIGNKSRILGVIELGEERILSWSINGVMILWEVQSEEILSFYFFEGILEVTKINNNKVLCIAGNGEHRFLKLQKYI